MKILLHNINYTVKEIDLVDQIIYQIFNGKEYLFSMGLNEDGFWESAEDINQEMVKEIGSIIDDKTF